MGSRTNKSRRRSTPLKVRRRQSLDSCAYYLRRCLIHCPRSYFVLNLTFEHISDQARQKDRFTPCIIYSSTTWLTVNVKTYIGLNDSHVWPMFNQWNDSTWITRPSLFIHPLLIRQEVIYISARIHPRIP